SDVCSSDLGAGFQLVVVPFDRVRFHFYIAGFAIHLFLCSFGNGSAPRLTTFTAASAGLPNRCTNGLTSVAPEWSSPPRCSASEVTDGNLAPVGARRL